MTSSQPDAASPPTPRGFLRRLLPRKPPRARLGVLAILKNESWNLREWIDHYRWQGVEKFFLIDNGSTDGGADLVRGEVASGLVEWYVCLRRHAQVAHYRTVFHRASIRRKVEWLVVADLDEFWYAPRSSLRDEVGRLEGIDLVYANWRYFGSNGFIEHPPSLRRCLTRRHPDLGSHASTKWIVRTDAVRFPWQLKMHKVKGISSERVVSDNERFHLNHYVTQSLHYFTKVKMTRGDASTRRSDEIRNMEYFKIVDDPATLEDRVLADLCAKSDASSSPTTSAPPPAEAGHQT